jgi:hypothetical protein
MTAAVAIVYAATSIVGILMLLNARVLLGLGLLTSAHSFGLAFERKIAAHRRASSGTRQ